MQDANFLDAAGARAIAAEYGTPVYVYDQVVLETQAREMLAFPNPYGLTVRYAMKALPTAAILRLMQENGLHFDASSGYEAERALRAGLSPESIQITAQECPTNLVDLVNRGVLFTACSLNQLRTYGRQFPGTEITLRVNPGKGSGHSNRTNVGGPAASFGLWHEHVDEAKAIARQYGLTITGMHTHIGSGSDPEVWKHCARLSLGIAARLPDVTTLSLGGGFKVGRMPGETSADVQQIGTAVMEDIRQFAAEHGRELHLEVEPGTYLTANAGAIVASVIDVVGTGPAGYDFIKLDTGMSELLRPSMYGSQHPITVVPHDGGDRPSHDYVVVGHCCESGDILTPAPGDPEGLQPRTLIEAEAGDLVVIGGAGAYCSSMSAKNYNSFPEAPEVLIEPDGSRRLIRRRQNLDSMLGNEIL